MIDSLSSTFAIFVKFQIQLPNTIQLWVLVYPLPSVRLKLCAEELIHDSMSCVYLQIDLLGQMIKFCI